MEDPAARGPHLNSVLARLGARLVDPELWPAGRRTKATARGMPADRPGKPCLQAGEGRARSGYCVHGRLNANPEPPC